MAPCQGCAIRKDPAAVQAKNKVKETAKTEAAAAQAKKEAEEKAKKEAAAAQAKEAEEKVRREAEAQALRLLLQVAETEPTPC